MGAYIHMRATSKCKKIVSDDNRYFYFAVIKDTMIYDATMYDH